MKDEWDGYSEIKEEREEGVGGGKRKELKMGRRKKGGVVMKAVWEE